jgi:putative Ca2+/H+ antiporter (TMEM165/GDT1 family)
MNLGVAAICFPVIFLGELPDKTMFASIVMATRGRPLAVWLGSAAAFGLHCALAVTVGVALFRVLPHRALEGVVAGLFLAGAAYSWVAGGREEDELAAKEASRHGALFTAFAVIFLAEWGDLTQILIANLAARYHAPLSVAVGSAAALWLVAAIAVAGGRSLLRVVDVTVVRRVTAVVLAALGSYAAVAASR